MLAAFKAIRYTVFGESSLVSGSWQRRVLTNHYFQGFFVICNATIASVAVWNMSIVQFMDWKRTLPLERDSTRMSILTLTYFAVSSTQIDAYLIFLGSSGLALILPVSVTLKFAACTYTHGVL